MVNDVFSYLKQEIKSLEIFKVLDDNTQPIKDLAKKFDKFEKILVIGTGGSSLGGKSLVSFNSMFYGKNSRLIFLENIDSLHFNNIIQNCVPQNTGIIVISKSGKTTETLMLFLTICELWPEFDYKNQAVAITEFSENNDLKILAESKDMQVIEHDPNICGRFSVFSVVGLLPAVLGGVDIDLFINGAKNVLNDVLNSQKPEDCSLFQDIVSMYRVFSSRKVQEHVLMIYSDMFEEYGKWYAQLISESLGKSEEFGITPVKAVGTIDQHSMLQLFLGGPSNKLFTLIMQKNNLETPKINSTIKSDVINTLNKHNIDDLMRAHQRSIIEVLRKKASVRVLEFEQFNIETLGFLMMLSFIEVVTIAKLAGVNPFNQPDVEEPKKLVLQYITD